MAHHCSNKALGLLIFLSLLSTICSAQLVPEFTHSEPVDPADAAAPAPEVDEDGAELAPAPSIEFENDEPLTPPPPAKTNERLKKLILLSRHGRRLFTLTL
ncbi:hypothetical protein ACSQ67_026276 [Phaseolus vulgaris]